MGMSLWLSLQSWSGTRARGLAIELGARPSPANEHSILRAQLKDNNSSALTAMGRGVPLIDKQALHSM